MKGDKNNWKWPFIPTFDDYFEPSDLEIENAELKKAKKELVAALRYFTDRVEGGTARSKITYSMYIDLLAKHDTEYNEMGGKDV